MMDPDKELALLEQEFPKSHRAWIRNTPIALDDRILALAARHASYLKARYELQQEIERLDTNPEQGSMQPPLIRPPKGASPRVSSRPVPPVQESFSDDPFISRSMSVSSSQEPALPPGAEKLMILLRGASQQEWLSRVSSIVLLGDIELAIYLLNEYRDRFMDS